LGKKVQENLPKSHITRIESRAGLGIPDMLIAFEPEGLFVMMELKVVIEKLPAYKALDWGYVSY